MINTPHSASLRRGPVSISRTAVPRSTSVSQAPGVLEKSFVVFVLLVAMGAFLNLGTNSLADPSDVSSGTPALQIVRAFISLISVMLLFRCRGWFRTLWAERWVFSLSIFVALSLLWSDAQAVTARRVIVFAATVGFALYFALRFPLRAQLRLLAVSLGIAALCSVLFAAFGIGTPTEVFHSAWNGVFLHKNALGHEMALAFLVFVLAGRERAIPPVIGFAGAGLSLVLVLMSRSATSLVLLGLMSILLLLALTSIIRHPSRIALGLLLLLALGWSIFFGLEQYSDVLHALGKDSSLTGRTEIWSASLNEAMKRPMLGYGYSAFWLGKEAPSRYIWQELHWSVPHAHDGYIDVILQLGVVGLGLVGVALIAQLRNSMRLIGNDHAPAALWPFAFLCFFLLSNITESDLLRPHSLSLVLYVSSVFAAWRAVHRLRPVNRSLHTIQLETPQRIPA